MPNAAEEALQKVTLNLFRKDVEGMERRYGRGWTEQVRLLVRGSMNSYHSLRATLDAEEPRNGK